MTQLKKLILTSGVFLGLATALGVATAPYFRAAERQPAIESSHAPFRPA